MDAPHTPPAELDPRALHRQVWNAIPWVVNGTAPAEERQLVDRHVAGCADCRDELAFHRRLQAGMAADAAATPDAQPGLDRLLARIDQTDGTAGLADPAGPALPAAPPPRHGLVRWLAAAVIVQAVALGALLGLRPGAPAADGGRYATLSSAPPHAAAVIRLVPSPDVTLAALRTLLDRAGLQIVDSSGDGAHFGLAPRAGASTSVAAALAALRADPRVLLAEPIGPPP